MAGVRQARLRPNERRFAGDGILPCAAHARRKRPTVRKNPEPFAPARIRALRRGVAGDGLLSRIYRLGHPFLPKHIHSLCGDRLALDRRLLGPGTRHGRSSRSGALCVRDLGLGELVSFTVAANARSRRVMEKLGMTHDAADDFEHPRLPEGHPLRRHVLYRLRRPDPRLLFQWILLNSMFACFTIGTSGSAPAQTLRSFSYHAFAAALSLAST